VNVALTPEQIRELTRHRRSDAQKRELDHLSIPYRVRRDGSPVVLVKDLPGLPASMEQSAEPELMP
jgi:hypothetical protein